MITVIVMAAAQDKRQTDFSPGKSLPGSAKHDMSAAHRTPASCEPPVRQSAPRRKSMKTIFRPPPSVCLCRLLLFNITNRAAEGEVAKLRLKLQRHQVRVVAHVLLLAGTSQKIIIILLWRAAGGR